MKSDFTLGDSQANEEPKVSVSESTPEMDETETKPEDTSKEDRLAAALEKIADLQHPAKEPVHKENDKKSVFDSLGIDFPELDDSLAKELEENDGFSPASIKLLKSMAAATKDGIKKLADRYSKEIDEIKNTSKNAELASFWTALNGDLKSEGLNLRDYMTKDMSSWSPKVIDWINTQKPYLRKAMFETLSNGSHEDVADILRNIQASSKKANVEAKIKEADSNGVKLPSSMASLPGKQAPSAIPDNLEESNNHLEDFHTITKANPALIENLFANSARRAGRGSR
jgi:hypothetical protein